MILLCRPGSWIISLFHRWNYTAKSDEVATVLPDGCRDILVVSQAGVESEIVHFTQWDTCPRAVKICAGTSIVGYRLRPGVMVAESDLKIDIPDLSKLDQLIDGAVRQDHESLEIIDALSGPDETTESLARQNGVSSRTLQRHFKNLSIPAPGFWRLLGRARRAARAMPMRVPISEIALEYGYSDQAHMTREFVRWFGLTPVRLRQSPAVLNELSQPGLGNWSDEIGLSHVIVQSVSD